MAAMSRVPREKPFKLTVCHATRASGPSSQRARCHRRSVKGLLPKRHHMRKVTARLERAGRVHAGGTDRRGGIRLTQRRDIMAGRYRLVLKKKNKHCRQEPQGQEAVPSDHTRVHDHSRHHPLDPKEVARAPRHDRSVRRPAAPRHVVVPPAQRTQGRSESFDGSLHHRGHQQAHPSEEHRPGVSGATHGESSDA